MKKNMKKLLVIALALMPSLSISVMAQSLGGGPSDPDPECIPFKPHPSPNPNPAPRCLPDDPDGMPLVEPISLPGPTPGINPGPRIRSNCPDDIPVVPAPALLPHRWSSDAKGSDPFASLFFHLRLNFFIAFGRKQRQFFVYLQLIILFLV